MQALFGPMPEGLLRRSKNADKYYDSDGRSPSALRKVGCADPMAGNLLSKSHFPQSSLEGFVDNPELEDGADKKEFVDFITSMLKLAPGERLDAEDLLKSKWLNQSSTS